MPPGPLETVIVCGGMLDAGRPQLPWARVTRCWQNPSTWRNCDLDPSVITLIVALGGAVVGAVASTLGTVSVQRAGHRRASRARQVRDLLPPARRRASTLMDEVMAGRGPITAALLEDELDIIEREALWAGGLDGVRARWLVDVARELWRLDRQVWEESAIGRELKMEINEALDEQLRALTSAIGALDNYELWLRGHLEKPWWRRRPDMAATSASRSTAALG